MPLIYYCNFFRFADCPKCYFPLLCGFFWSRACLDLKTGTLFILMRCHQTSSHLCRSTVYIHLSKDGLCLFFSLCGLNHIFLHPSWFATSLQAVSSRYRPYSIEVSEKQNNTAFVLLMFHS